MDACALYRQFIPHLNIDGSRFIFHPGQIALHLFIEADVAIVQRQVSANNYAALLELKKYGMKIIYDLDDNLWSITADNPAYKYFQDVKAGFGQCAEVCDLITVSTPGLASAVRTALGRRNIAIAPNAIDYRLFPPPRPRDDGRIVIGWAGSNTHDVDIEAAWSVLPEVIQNHPNVWLELVGGTAPPKELKGHPRVKSRGWIPVGEFGQRMATWAWDITIAPLADTRFNRSKSNIKILEASAINAAILVSDVQPYAEFFQLAKTQWPVCKTREDWRKKLTMLVNEPELRHGMAKETRRVAEEWYDIKNVKEIWIKTCWDLLH